MYLRSILSMLVGSCHLNMKTLTPVVEFLAMISVCRRVSGAGGSVECKNKLKITTVRGWLNSKAQ